MARRAGELERLARELAPVPVSTYAIDVRDADALARAARDFIDAHGVPDIVVANAGVSRGTLADEADDLAAFRDVFDTNVMGLVNTLHPFIAPMRAARHGTLVGVASLAGIRGLPGAGAYSASKAAVTRVLESLRVELRGSGVAVVTIAPGYIATPMTARNPYRMPFLMDADRAARRRSRARSRARKRWHVTPWPMAIVARALALMPRPLYDRLFANAPRKPREP